MIFVYMSGLILLWSTLILGILHEEEDVLYCMKKMYCMKKIYGTLVACQDRLISTYLCIGLSAGTYTSDDMI